MRVLIVVNNPQEWPLAVPGVEVVAARSYLIDPKYADIDRAKVFNFCRSYRYQARVTTCRCWRRRAGTSPSRTSQRSRI